MPVYSYTRILKPDLDLLTVSINDSQMINKSLSSMRCDEIIEGGQNKFKLQIWFEEELSSEDKTILDSLI